jgi:hypothetical protein
MSKDEEGKQFQVKEENPCDKDEDCSVTKSKSFDSITTMGTLDKKNAFKHQGHFHIFYNVFTSVSESPVEYTVYYWI